jgi:hypothetical protein
MRYDLIPHPESPRGPVSALGVEVVRTGDVLDLRYRLNGLLDRIAIPAPAAQARRDDLWKHTCFEVFIRAGDEAGYCEFNVSPSTHWAAYSFSGYREGMAELAVPAPRIARRMENSTLELSVSLDLSAEPVASQQWRLAISAVIENDTEQRSYWALAHPSGKPDFHHADGFVLELTDT